MHNALLSPDDRFDVAIIGAGVVGCAIARQLTLDGARVVVLERAADILDGASKANSAILHTGFDAPPDTLESHCIRRGRTEYRAIHDALGLPLDACGALVLAWNESEEAALPALVDKARANGVDDIVLLGRQALLRQEPTLGKEVRAGFRVPGESLIDAWSAPYAYLNQAIANGAVLHRSCTLLGGSRHEDRWQLETSRGRCTADRLVNAAGLFGDHVDNLMLGKSLFEIRPRKGQFIVYDKPAAALARHVLLPVPTAITKGVVVCRTVYGNLLVGPTAEEQSDRDTATLDTDTLRALSARGEKILPALANHEITAMYAGLRPASDTSEYRIISEEALGYVSVGGIRSTGLSAALGIACHVADRISATGGTFVPLDDPLCPLVGNISECAARDWQSAGNGGIVCHCESVTRREITSALSGPLAARTLGGLKRRTRVTMGRCQGFHCSAALAKLTRDHFSEPMAQPAGTPSVRAPEITRADQALPYAAPSATRKITVPADNDDHVD